MLSDKARSQIIDIFPFLRTISLTEWEVAQPTVVNFPPKTCFFQKKNAAIYNMFLLEGTAQITLIGESGNEMIVSRLSAGAVCSLLTLSGLSDRDYPGSIIAETDVKVLFVLKSSFLHWIQKHEQVQKSIFGELFEAILDMSESLHGQQMESIDVKLIKALLYMTTEEQPLLATTHQELSVEIGTAREVVTRALKRYRQKGWITTGRGWIKIIQRSELKDQLGDYVTEKQNHFKYNRE